MSKKALIHHDWCDYVLLSEIPPDQLVVFRKVRLAGNYPIIDNQGPAIFAAEYESFYEEYKRWRLKNSQRASVV